MKDIKEWIHQRISEELKAQGFDLVDLLPIPKNADPMIRLRTLEEAIAEFDSEREDHVSYLIQVKKKEEPLVISKSEPLEERSFFDGIYSQDGKLNTTYLLENAKILYRSGEYALSRNVYRAIYQSGEKAAVSLYGMGLCFESEGRFSEAEKCFEESIAYQPSLASYQHLAQMVISQKKDEYAAEILERALHLEKLKEEQQFDLHFTCGNCWNRVGKLDKAEVHYKKALYLRPSAYDIQSNLASLYLKAGKAVEAIRCYQDSIASHATAEAFSGLGSVFLAQDRKAEALDAFVKSARIQLQNPDVIFHVIKLAYELKKYHAAAEIVSQYIEISPVNVSLLYSLAGLYFHLNQISKCREILNRILKIRPDHQGAMELGDKLRQRET